MTDRRPGTGLHQRAIALSLGFPLAMSAAACGSRTVVEDEALLNATYLTDAVPRGLVTLTDGTYTAPATEAATSGIRIELKKLVRGDLDGDGIDDAAVILSEEPGSGHVFLQLHALVNRDSVARDVARQLVGDHVDVDEFEIESGLIHVGIRVRPPGASMASEPVSATSATYALTDQGLRIVESASAETRTAVGETARALGGDLVGPAWTLSEVSTSDPSDAELPEDERPTLSFLPELTDEGGISGRFNGFGGCNRAFGNFRAESGGGLTLSGVATTLTRCPPARMELERRFVRMIRATLAYRVSDGRLEIETSDGTLVFTSGA